MALARLSLGMLQDFDGGRPRETFDQAMRRCIADCKDRPALDEARQVTLTVSIVPVPDQDTGDCESVDVRFKISDQVPKRQSKVYNGRITAQGVLFNELSPDEVRQGTIDQVDVTTGEVRNAR